MILEQYYLGCLAHASYLIGDVETGTAVVVDPQRDVDGYLQDAARLGLTIKHVFLTHFHADFVAGHLELRDQVGAEIRLGAQAEPEYAFTSMASGQTLEFGKVRLKVLETPGHTPEGICILVYDLEADADKPHAVLTGDTLFIGDVGRPDLLASEGFEADDLASMLYDSLHNQLLPLPDETLVYPGHGAGSLCGKNLSTDKVSTIGEQRIYNYALQPMSKPDFISMVTADQPPTPEYFSHDVALNKKDRVTQDQTTRGVLAPLSLEEVLRQQGQGAQVLDVRDAADYEGAHMAGVTNVGLGGSFAPWAGAVLDTNRPIVLIADPGTEAEAALRLSRIGLDDVVGYLDGGMQALESRSDLLRRTERIAAATLAERLALAEKPVILDVRSEDDWKDKHIEGSLNFPLIELRKRIADVPKQGQMVVHCAGGYRSAIALSILEQHGIVDTLDLVGGMGAWEASQLETVGATA